MSVFDISSARVTDNWLQQPDRFWALPEIGSQSGSDEQRSQLLPQSQRTARRHASGRFAMPRTSQFVRVPMGVIATGMVVTNRGAYRPDYEVR
jgi:hypothetical protein